MKKDKEWDHLEDLAVASDPGSVEFKYVVQVKGEEAVNRRREFLEIQK